MSSSPSDSPSAGASEPQPPPQKSFWHRLLARIRAIPRLSWRERLISFGPALVLIGLLVWLAFRLTQPPPHTLTISSGPPGSIFYSMAERYRPILAQDGITLKVLPSQGSLENLERLDNPHSGVDIALVQSGVTLPGDRGDIVSLGSLFYEPLALFYRNREPLTELSQLRGRDIGVGTVGSGTHTLALALLQANGITPDGSTHLENIEGNAAMEALLNEKVGAIFLSGDSATPANFRTLLRAPGIRMFNFVQADAYVRHFRYLSDLEIPAGTFDLGENLPPQSMHLLAPTVELLAHSKLHPALVDLLIEAAQKVNGRATLLQKWGEFPAPLRRAWPIDSEAARFYKSGKTFLYRFLPFSLASLLNRTLLILVPLLVILIPAVQFAPAIYRWLMKNRLYRRYARLMALERAALEPLTPQQRARLMLQLDAIERDLIALKMPGAYAYDLYVLRQTVTFVRQRLSQAA